MCTEVLSCQRLLLLFSGNVQVVSPVFSEFLDPHCYSMSQDLPHFGGKKWNVATLVAAVEENEMLFMQSSTWKRCWLTRGWAELAYSSAHTWVIVRNYIKEPPETVFKHPKIGTEFVFFGASPQDPLRGSPTVKRLQLTETPCVCVSEEEAQARDFCAEKR